MTATMNDSANIGVRIRLSMIAISVCLSSPYDPDIPRCLVRLANELSLLKKIEWARGLNQAALSILDRGPNNAGLATVRINLGILAKESGNRKEAKREFNKSLEHARKAGFVAGVKRAKLELSRV